MVRGHASSATALEALVGPLLLAELLEGGQAAGDYNPGLIFNRFTNWPMISDPRFVRLCHKLRYIDFWLEAGRWPDCADQVSYDFNGEARRLAGAGV